MNTSRGNDAAELAELREQLDLVLTAVRGWVDRGLADAAVIREQIAEDISRFTFENYDRPRDTEIRHVLEDVQTSVATGVWGSATEVPASDRDHLRAAYARSLRAAARRMLTDPDYPIPHCDPGGPPLMCLVPDDRCHLPDDRDADR